MIRSPNFDKVSCQSHWIGGGNRLSHNTLEICINKSWSVNWSSYLQSSFWKRKCSSLNGHETYCVYLKCLRLLAYHLVKLIFETILAKFSLFILFCFMFNIFNPRVTMLFFVTRLTKGGLLLQPLNFPNQTPYEIDFGINR